MRVRVLHKEDLEEFVLAGMRSDEELIWFGRPSFGGVWRYEFASALTRVFLIVAGLLGLLTIVVFAFSGISTLLVILFLVSLGSVILRLAWIYYLGRRLTYAITSSRLLYLLEAGRPIEYKSYLLSGIKRIDRVDHADGSCDLLLPEQKDALYGIAEGALVEKSLGYFS